MKRLALDFTPAREGASRTGLAALAAGLAACVAVILFQQQLLERIARAQAELGALASRRPAQNGAARSVRKQGEAIERANLVARELARRWDLVFLALESARSPDVALLAIEPDAAKSLLRVTAEAKGKREMLAYVARLHAAQPLEQVMLESHEVLVQVPEKPVRFIVSATLEMRP